MKKTSKKKAVKKKSLKAVKHEPTSKEALLSDIDTMQEELMKLVRCLNSISEQVNVFANHLGAMSIINEAPF